MSRPVDGNRNQPITSEARWPYSPENQRRACSWVAKQWCRPTCEATEACACPVDQASCGRPVDEAELARANDLPMAKLTQATRLERDKISLMTALAKGQDIWMAMRFTYDAFDEGKLLQGHDGLSFVIPHFDPSSATSSHAMLIAGYRTTPKGTYFLIHNSWGESWGERGYAWVHETTLTTNLQAAYVVDAEPWSPSSSRVPPRQSAPSQCPEGTLADSITGQCTPPCPDGSARHNAACADPSDCPPGHVNVYGECVVAAPDVRGTDPGSGIRYACAAAGCSYVIPAGVLGCSLPWCSVSCPSPRFRLTSSALGFRCSE
jgi:hypothetical protein